jgi:amino acid transporter
MCSCQWCIDRCPKCCCVNESTQQRCRIDLLFKANGHSNSNWQKKYVSSHRFLAVGVAAFSHHVHVLE